MANSPLLRKKTVTLPNISPLLVRERTKMAGTRQKRFVVLATYRGKINDVIG